MSSSVAVRPAPAVARATPVDAARTPARRSAGASASGGNHRHAGPLRDRAASSAPGRPLPEALRRRLTPVVGTGAAAAARVHTDDGAAALAGGNAARAVAVGPDIFFAAGHYRPGTRDGDWLIAHEVAHVAQAQRGLLDRPAFLAVAPAEPTPLESAADLVADLVVADADRAGQDRATGADERTDESDGGVDTTPARAPSTGAPVTSEQASVAEEPAAAVDLAASGGAAQVAPAAGPATPPDVPLMPEPALGLSPSEQARLGGVERRAAAATASTATAPAAAENVAVGEAAVQVPQAESDARAAAEVVDALAGQEKPSIEIVELCERIRRLIAAKRPADEEGVIDTRPAEVAAQAGQGVQTGVAQNVEATKASYGPIDATPQGSAPATAPGIEPLPSAVPTAPVAATSATPDAVPPEQVSLEQDTAAMAERSREAGLEKETAALVTSGPVAEARAARGELGTLAANGPADALKAQQEALTRSDEDLAALQAKAVASLAAARSGHAGGVTDQQAKLKEGSEGLRARLSKEADAVFTDARTRVSELLEKVPETAMGRWNAGLPPLTATFNSDLKIVKGKVEERHEGVSGFFVAGWDAVTGLPDWVTEAYDAAEKNFGDGVCALILEISSYVNGIIKIADEIIATARTKITAIFTSDLPADQQEWAAQQLAAFGSKLDALHDRAEATRTSFTKELVENAGQAVQAAREKIQKLRQEAQGLWGRFLDAVGRFLDDPVKFIIDGLLEILGISPPAFWAVLEKIKQAAADIVDAPIRFANSLMGGLAAGFQLFFDNIGKHLIAGLLEWLLSGLKQEGITIEIPKELSLRNVVVFALQLLGISWARIRKLLVEQLGDKSVAIVEKAAGYISTLATKGIGGIFEAIESLLQPKAIIDAIIDAAIRYISETLIVKVAQKIIMMLNPAGAILAALEAIYRVLKWVFTNAARIFHLIEAVVNGLVDVISGNVAGVAKTVEKALAMLVAPVIDFLADYLGLGGLPGKVAGAVKGLQAWVEGVLRSVIRWLVDTARKLLATLGIGGKDDKKPTGAAVAVGERVPFEGGGEAHEVFVTVSGKNAVIMMRSEVTTVEQWLKDRTTQLGFEQTPAKVKSEAPPLLSEARKLAGLTDTTADVVATEVAPATDPAATPAPEKIEKDQAELVQEERTLAGVLKQIADLYGLAEPVVVRSVIASAPLRLEPPVARTLSIELAEGDRSAIYLNTKTKRDDTLIANLMDAHPAAYRDGTLSLPPPDVVLVRSAGDRESLGLRVGRDTFVRRVDLRSGPTGFSLDAGYQVLGTGVVTGPRILTPKERIAAFRALPQIAATTAGGRFKPIKAGTAVPYPLSSADTFGSTEYEKHFAGTEKVNREDVRLDLNEWLAEGAAGGLARVSSGSYQYVVVSGSVYEDLVADTTADAGVDLELKDAVAAAGGILEFMRKMAANKVVGTIGWNRFVDEVWEKTANSDWLKERFRGADDGMHEWIPSDHIPQSIARASDPVKFLDGPLWIDLHHELRTDTSWLIFRPPAHWLPDTVGLEKMWIPQGHTGAVYIGDKPQNSFQKAFHDALRNEFKASTGIRSCIESVYGVFEIWIWNGVGGLRPLHPGLRAKGGVVLTPATLAGYQASNYANVVEEFDGFRARFRGAAT